MHAGKEYVSCRILLLVFQDVILCTRILRAEQPNARSSRLIPRKRSALAHLLFQRFDRHFLEEHDVVVAVILQAEPAEVRAGAVLWLEVKFLFRYWIAFLKVCDLLAIQRDDGVWTVQGDVHRV